MSKYLKNLTKLDKILYGTFISLTFIILLINLISPSIYSFAQISILANFFLILVFREVLKLLKVKFSKKELFMITIVILSMYAFYMISLSNRNFIYFSDFSCYYNITLTSKEKFATSLIEGIRYFGGSTWSGEYGNFLTFFPEIIFKFTDETINSYLLSYILVYTPYLILALSIFLKKLSQKLNIKKESLFFNLGLFVFLLSPILHATAIYGQPDFFGLTFIFLIIVLTMNYDFKKFEVVRLILILLITFMLIISRRWYLYFVVVYYLCYIVKIFLDNMKDKESLKVIFKNIIIYGFIVILFFLLILFPLIKNILFNSMGDYSAFYLTGGFKMEILSQVEHTGYLMLLLMLIGIIYGLRFWRRETVLSIIGYFLMIFFFTRIQNMGLHHSLILLPVYLYLLYLCLAFLLSIEKGIATRYCILFVSIILLNFIYGLCLNSNDKLFTKVGLVVPNEENYDAYVQVANWLKENISEQETAYMICHNRKYNPDKFRSIFMPDKTIHDYLPYGSAVIGSHYFPYGLFDAKYILTVTPFESISMEYKYNDVFLQLVEENKFRLINAFSMNETDTILVYERVEKVDEKEKQLYLNAIEEESGRYPELYKNVIESYVVEE